MKPVPLDVMNHCLASVDKLPQAKHIPMERRRRWIEATYNTDPDRIDWHVERLKGFGGSEIGALVLGLEGKAGRMSQARFILMSKLMMTPPEEPNHAMVLGLLGEPLVKSQFLKTFELQSHPELIERFVGSVHSKLPWMRVTPDDINSVANSAPDAPKFLVDYKLPSEQVMREYRETNDIDFEYACQLSQGWIMASDLDIKIDGCMLVNLDTSAKDDGYVNVRELPFNAELAERIVTAGNYYYDMLLKGALPEIIRPKTVDVSKDPDLQALLTKYTAAMVVKNQADLLVDNVKDSINTLLDGREPEGKVINQLADFGIRKNVDDMAVLREAGRLDIDIEEYAYDEKRYNIKAIISDIEVRKDADLSNLYTVSHSLSLPRGTNNNRAKVVQEFNSMSSDKVNEVYLEMHKKVVDKTNEASSISKANVRNINDSEHSKPSAKPSNVKSSPTLTMGMVKLL